ncbi:mechanosensitive ion channel family protein [Pararhizobium sp. IMCC21322]|uniref:mechanosensitive ion channel family protein n=1 Tax=Pararhizobium sp. IMCC21322 TaxID=3067903 RepID=UPI00274269AE|nr:mechanosensitive ion channel family protein [Pararhizobium sp. IMCC21322]
MNWNVEPLSILAEQLNSLLRSTVELAPNIVAALLLLLVTWLIARLLGGAIRKVLVSSQSRPSLVVALAKLVRIFVWVIGILLTATLVFPGLTPTKLLAGLGIGSIAIGLAFKDIFENFLAGFLILLRKPMRIGDDIECEDLSGRVEQISVRDTFLRKRSGELVLVPNSCIYKNPVRILTDHAHRRISIIVGVAYGENVDAARDVISKALENIETRNREKPVEVFAQEFNSSSIDFMVRWWTGSTPLQEHQSRDQAVAAIKAALDEAGIEIPFPYRTLTFAQPLTINTESGGDQK